MYWEICTECRNKFKFVYLSPEELNSSGIFLSFDKRKGQSFPDCGAVGVDGCADGRDIVGIHGSRHAAVLGIDVADRDKLRLDRAEDRHGFGAFQGSAGDIQADLGGDTAAVHHTVEGSTGVRCFHIEAGPLDPVLGEVVQK